MSYIFITINLILRLILNGSVLFAISFKARVKNICRETGIPVKHGETTPTKFIQKANTRQ